MPHKFENRRINANIKTGEMFLIHGMQDYYLGVTFRYPEKTWNGCVPIKSKYQGTDIPLTDTDVTSWIEVCYTNLDPGRNGVWQDLQRKFWESKQAFDTQAVFDALNGVDVLTKWQCRKCGPVPKANPQSGPELRN